MIGWSLCLLITTAVPSEEQVLRAVQDDFERAGRTSPTADAALSRAARQIAERAITRGVEDAASLLRVTAAVSRSGGWDPNPVAVVLRGESSQLLATLRGNGLAREPISLVGVGVADGGDRAALAVLLARRKVDLESFPHALTRPSPRAHRLCGALREPLSSAEVFVTRPKGEVDRLEMLPSGGRRCAAIAFGSVGRHAVELLATGPRGPEVAALFFVDVGDAVPAEEGLSMPEATTDTEARAQILARINALRAQLGASALSPDLALDAVAQRWADRLGAENFFAHVAPDGSDLKARLRAASYTFQAAGENLGLSSGPLAAHFGIEHSPGHRRNLLEKDHRRLGVGIAKRADGMTVLVEVLAQRTEADPAAATDPLAAAYEAIGVERHRRTLRPLTRNALLEALAQQHARAAWEQRSPKALLPGRPRLHDQVFEALEEAKTVSVDIFIAASPRQIVESKSLASAKSTMVGVGVVRADSTEKGPGHYWIVVIYTGSR
jgi:uncharacterized protein YkwD